MKRCEIKESQASLCDKFDYDVINNTVVTFLSANTCYIIPDLADFEHVCYGTQSFSEKYLALNVV